MRRLIYRELITAHHKAYSDIKSMEENGTAFDLYRDGSKIINLKTPTCRFHTKGKLCFVIYMNENHIHGGTQFLRHTTNGRESVRSWGQQDMNEVFSQDTTIRFNTPWDYEPLEWQNTI